MPELPEVETVRRSLAPVLEGARVESVDVSHPRLVRRNENPADVRRAGEWARHEIDQPGNIETSRFWDVDGDGHVEIAPNAGGNVVFYRLVRDAAGKGTGKFGKHVVKLGGCGHGLGFGLDDGHRDRHRPGQRLADAGDNLPHIGRQSPV